MCDSVKFGTPCQRRSVWPYIIPSRNMPVLICLRKELWTGLISVGDQVPTCPVFTRAKIKSRLGILINLPSQYHSPNRCWVVHIPFVLMFNCAYTICSYVQLCIYHLFLCSILMHNSQWITYIIIIIIKFRTFQVFLMAKFFYFEDSL